MTDYIKILKYRMNNEGYKPEYINLVIDYAENLIENNLPVIFDIGHLSKYLEVSEESIENIVRNSSGFYSTMKIKNKKGKTRVLHIPNKKLKGFQSWILNNILYKVEVVECAKGFVLGKSIVDNALPHVNKEYVLNLDLRNFFGNIKEEQLNSVFLSIGYNREISKILSKLCSYDGFLPQGSPSSPYLSNLVCRELDKEILNFLDGKEITYTRYADDITFSSNKKLEDFLPILESIIENMGFKINRKKTRIQHKNMRQTVTGLVVNKKVSVPRSYIRELNLEIYYCKKFGVSGHLIKKDIFYSNYKHYLYGKAYFIKMVDREKGNKILKELDKVNWQY